MLIPNISDIREWHTKVVFVRVSVNLPLDDDGSIADEYRIERILPTIYYLTQQEAKVVIIAHLGRSPVQNLKVIHEYLAQYITVDFLSDFFVDDSHQSMTALDSWISEASAGSVLLLDNVRATRAEQANDQDLAQELARRGDIYVNEAFAASHRKHMSLDALPRTMKQAVAGFTCSEEVEMLEYACNPPVGAIAIIGGNKAHTKLPLIKRLRDTYEWVYVGGALANTLYYLKGYEIGRSVYEGDLDANTQSLAHELLEDERVVLPTQVVCETSTQEVKVKDISQITADDAIYDVAVEDITSFMSTQKDAKLVVWNGPLGYLEAGYAQGTYALAHCLHHHAHEAIVGGGNTVDALRDGDVYAGIDFLSTGGGAMIHFLTEHSLPALEALHR